jgi:hypothetical protein
MTHVKRYIASGVALGVMALIACGSSSSQPGGQSGFDGGGGGPGADGSTSYADGPIINFNEDASPACVGLQCQQVACSGGGTTSVSGTVYAPNGTLPLYDVIVYVPNAPLDPMPQGITCDQCGTVASGSPIATALSDATGKFVLNNVPVGSNIPLVVQLGKWRRQTIIPSVPACTNTKLTDPNLTRLPKNQKEGNMPHIALTTGGCDSLGCMLGKLGIDPTEFGVQSDGYAKAINVYSSAGDTSLDPFSDGLSNTTPADTLWSNLTLLKTYDMSIFSCECSEALVSKGVPAGGQPFGTPEFQQVTNYLDLGGRIFTTDFQYLWYRYSPDPNMGATAADPNDAGIAVITGGAPVDPDPASELYLNETFPKGLALAEWLTTVFPANPLVQPDGGPLAGAGVACPVVFDNIQSLKPPPQLWASASSLPHVFTVNTPVGVPTTQQCGKGVHIDAHVTQANQGDPDFVGCNNGGTAGPVGSAGCYPNTCTNPLQEDEAMFAFFFFDLASCIQNEGAPPLPPPPK